MTTRIRSACMTVVTLMCAVAMNLSTAFAGPVESSNGHLGIKFVVNTANWGQYLLVTEVTPGSGAALAGIEPGDSICRVNNQRVTGGFSLAMSLRNVFRTVSVQVCDAHTNQWSEVQVRVRLQAPPNPNQPPPPPNPGNGNNGGNGNGNNGNANVRQIAGVWRSNRGGTVQFIAGQDVSFAAVSNVPLFGRSDMSCTFQPDGSIGFSYQQRQGLQDSGSGRLEILGPNRMKGYLVNSVGIRMDFELTR